MTNILTYSHLGLTSKEKCYENKNNCIDTYNSMEALVLTLVNVYEPAFWGAFLQILL